MAFSNLLLVLNRVFLVTHILNNTKMTFQSYGKVIQIEVLLLDYSISINSMYLDISSCNKLCKVERNHLVKPGSGEICYFNDKKKF